MNAMHNAPASDPSLVYPSPLKEFWQAFAHNKAPSAACCSCC